nr:DUF2637 domain-containing protein [Streptomyces adustus]
MIGVVVTGALVIAGIGFAGSYAAVRELAIKKGFGNFSYVFPIGIDAGICVLLALDLLLTWIRIPFPLLRQTAWLLTAATIAFNGAAAWPDPLGTGMHAVIPILFVVAVEAARHAIGRIADITADKHMEGVRLTRWLLSPLPTFLLWRRMKLWELRSYEQVIKLEQERLVYQARLHSRFGRTWRRKAPVESLMPLRLARYGVPLSETAPAGLAAAGIDAPPIQFTVERATVPAQRQSPEPETTVVQETEQELAQVRGPQQPQLTELTRDASPGQPHEPQSQRHAQHLADAYQAWLAAFGSEPTSAQFALWLQDQYGIATAAGSPLSDKQLEPLLRLLKQRHAATNEKARQAPQDADVGWVDYFYSAWLTYAHQHGIYPDAATLATYVYERDQVAGSNGQPITGEDLEHFVAGFRQREFDETEPAANSEAAEFITQEPSDEALPHAGQPEEAPVGADAHPATEMRNPRANAAIDQADEDDTAKGPATLTTVDRYYLAWAEYQTEHGEEPRAEQLSAYLANTKGMNGRGGKPVSPSTLRRYLLPFRVYNLWAEQRVRNDAPSLEVIAQECAAHGITAQHNRPLATDYIAALAVDFERRWHALIRHHAQSQ